MSASGFHFREEPARRFPEPWREIDRSVARWVLAHGGPIELAIAAGWTSLADGDGDSALCLDEDSARKRGICAVGELRGALEGMADSAEDDWVTRAQPGAALESGAPFVLAGNALYFRRNFQHEAAIARLLLARLAATTEPGRAVVEDDLLALFDEAWRDEEGPQRQAVVSAVGKRLFVLTGGPGTGKTTTVLRMLMAIERDFRHRHGRPPAIRIGAPTGKAAQRLVESLRAGALRFGAEAETARLTLDWQRALQTVLGAEASTLHRMLGARGMAGGFQHDRDNPLPADIVVVDEASMVDLSLWRALLEAVPEEATLVLVGDADQLAPVGTGSALSDLVAALEGSESLVRLRHCFRADDRLNPVLDAVRRGDAAGFERAWHDAAEVTERLRVHEPQQLAPRLIGWAKNVANALRDGGVFGPLQGANTESLLATIACLRRNQLLCAVREGVFGCVQANQALERLLKRSPELTDWRESTWYPGRAVIILRNDYASGLFNGDVGLCLMVADASGVTNLKIVFEGAPGQETSARLFDPDSLPDHETAFALTVHKSQGSEYGHVAVLLPPDRAHPLLVRQMLYTAVSRARQRVSLWADQPALEAAIERRLERVGGLVEALKGMGPAAA